ncbi:hypothetical protein BB561_003184 [Smittium simulii]|uniref:Nitrogen permease regulator 2 n=1 Tax=Smittium simulii TaxID=133385 RepID=A0A2T9YMM1_9FUNG|nr:hypothetical protein BB561_003184 [Smittium simulii]
MAVPQIYSIFLIKFHTTRGPEIDFVVPKDKTAEICGGNSSSESFKPDSSSNNKLSSIYSLSSKPDISSTAGFYKKEPENVSFCHQTTTKFSSEGIIDFNALSSILMPKQILHQKTIKVSFKDHKVLGYPISVIGAYERNALIFNCCFVFKKSVNASFYNMVVKRFGLLIKNLEINFGFLRNRIFRSSLKLLVEKLMQDLNMFGESQILLKLPSTALEQSPATIEFNIKLFPTFSNSIEIKSYHVPVLIVSPNSLIQPNESKDMSMERIIRHINNVNHVRRISQLADISEDRFTNNYVTTAELNNLLESDELQADCIEFVTNSSAKMNNLPKIPYIFSLYSCLTGDLRLSEWIITHNVNWNQIDIRKFIMFGVLNGFITQVRQYPIIVNKSECIDLGWDLTLINLLDGSRHLDELAFILGTETVSLISFLNSHPSCVALISK